MAEQRRVILYGKSLILGSVGASLRGRPDLEVVPLAPPLPEARELEALAPAAILFDLEAAQPDAALRLLKGHPRLLLIGIDPAGDEILILSGRQERAAAVADLLSVIQGAGAPTGGDAVTRGRGELEV
ncbi:MAG TPA: hypothetical protein PKO09_10280 [Anaerolineae bacterium]|nr:hypothetical protein [Anaerolineae bacterium]